MTISNISYARWMQYVRHMDVNISGREKCKLWYLRHRLEWTMSLPPFNGGDIKDETDLYIYRAALRFMSARLTQFIESGAYDRHPPYTSLLEL